MKRTGKPSPGLPSDPALAVRARELLGQGQAFLRDGRIAEAARTSAELVRIAPTLAEGHELMGRLAMRTGAPDIAASSFRAALDLKPKSAELLVALAQSLLALGQARDAAELLDRGRTRHPNDGNVFRELGQAQLDLGETEAARKSFARAAKLRPGDLYARHMLAALTVSGTPDADYVAALFDSYAENFDEHLGETLAYRVPQALSELLARHGSLSGPTLDIGCGTGLMAAALPAPARPIDGLDIAPNMIAKAAARGLYRHLSAGDATALLATEPAFAGPYGLVLAADVFIYIGDFAALFSQAADRLTPGGRLAFSVETHAGEGIAIRSSGRFAHAPAYVRDLAVAHGLDLLEEVPHPIRLERKVPVAGALFVFGRR